MARRTPLRLLATLALVLPAVAVRPSLAEDIVVVVHPDQPAPTRAQITDVYLGRSRALRPLDQPVQSPLYARFYERLTQRDTAYVRSVWAAVLFTGRGRPPQVLPDAEAIKRTVAADPQAIGYIDRRALDDRVKAVLALE